MKYRINATDDIGIESLPSWECGLKSLDNDIEVYDLEVAPFVGVWIEIAYKQQKNADQESRSLRGSVD